MKIIKFKYLLILLLSLLLSSCSTSISKLNTQIELPKNFNTHDNKLSINNNWIMDLNDTYLLQLITKALNKNHNLKKLFYDIKIQKESLITNNSSLFPSLDLSLDRTTSGGDDDDTSSSTSVDLSLSYEVDLWGKLSDSAKQANANILVAQANYEQAKQQLIHDVLLSYYEIKEASILLELYQKHLLNLKNNYDVLKSQYKQGLSTALDTYLAQNSIYDKLKEIEVIKANKKQNIYALEKLLGEYPKGNIQAKNTLPLLKTYTNIDIPSSLIFKKPSILASWNELLSQNYQLAFTHKERLPSLDISLSLEKSLESGELAWSFIGGLTAPIFNAGKLKALENIEKYELKQAELSYLDTVYSALTSIENLLSSENSLKEQYEISIKTRNNSKESSQLSYNQYLKGLEPYTTVLSTQNTYYNSQISLIQIKQDLLENRLALHLALGGDFLKDNKNINEQNIKENK